MRRTSRPSRFAKVALVAGIALIGWYALARWGPPMPAYVATYALVLAIPAALIWALRR